jgi:hypothetical protein
MIDTLRPFASRIIASIVAAFASYLLVHFGVTLDAATQDGLRAVTLGLFGVVYSVVHKLLDKTANPSDAASSHIAATLTTAMVAGEASAPVVVTPPVVVP